MDRRRFTTLCSGLIAGAATVHAEASEQLLPYPRTALVFADGSDVTLEAVESGEAYVFSYPYRTTPCFLMRLSASAAGTGSWPGGVGKDKSVVSFSAICSHKMSHPAKPISHITYRADPITFYDASGQKRTQAGLISCCSERSVYDPAEAGKVLSGPAPQPLAAIALETDEEGRLFATGSYGPNQYERFLEKFGFRLAMEYGVTDVRIRATDRAEVVLAQHFSHQQVLC